MIIIGARPPISVGFEKKVEAETASVLLHMHSLSFKASYKVEILQATLQWTQNGNDFKLPYLLENNPRISFFFSPKNCGLHSSADYIRVRISFFYFFRKGKRFPIRPK